MFKHILVPVDLSDHNQRTVEIASEIARQNDSEITLLHVIETIDDVPFEELEDFYSGIEAKANEFIGDLVDSLEEQPRRLHRKIVYGRRIREILACVEASDIDLMILHSHRYRPDEPTRSLGTLSHEAAIFATCPVLLVK